MAKFFISKKLIDGNNIILAGQNMNHIINVLRHKRGDNIEISCEDGIEYICEITEIFNDKIQINIVDRVKDDSEPNVKITLYQALPKSEKMELIIQKCVELGIHSIVPINSERTIVNLSGKEDKKILRWNKISESATKQSRRGKVPQIKNVLNFKDAIIQARLNHMNIIPFEKEKNIGLRDFVRKFDGTSIGIFIGPEGGFSQNEIDYARLNNVLPITLGKRILRTETAGFITTAILLYELED